MKRCFGIILGVLIIGGLFAGQSLAEQKPLNWLASTQGTSVYQITTNFARFARQNSGVQVYSSATGGTVENMRLLMQKEGDIAASVSADIVQAWNGFEPYTKQYRNIRQIFTHYDLTWFFMAPKKTNIKTLADLDGKRVGAASVGSSTASFTRLYTDHLKKEGIIKNVRLEYMSFTRQADMFVQGRLDAVTAYTLAGTEAGWCKSITHRIPWDEINIIPLQEKDFPMLRSKGYPAPLPIRIGERETGLKTAGLTGIQIVRDDMDEETVYKITKSIYDNLKAQGELRNAHAVLKKYAMEDFMNFFVKELPIHKGAARYFKEVGLWRNDLHVAD